MPLTPQFGFEHEYCIASHTAAARKAGMTEAMFGELMVAPFCERLPRNKAGEINHRTGGAGQLGDSRGANVHSGVELPAG